MTSIRSFPDSLRDLANKWFGAGGGAPQDPTDLTIPQKPRGPGGRRPHSEDPAPGTQEDAKAKIGRLLDLQQALANERRLQAQRVAALADCQGCVDPPANLDDLVKAMDQAKKDFEDLQNQLKAEAGKQLTAFDSFSSDYDKLWTAAMRGSDKYFEAFPEIKGLGDLLTAIGDRKWARQVAEWVDTALQAAQIGLGVYNLGASAVKGLAAAEGAAETGVRAAVDAGESEGVQLGKSAVRDAGAGEAAGAEGVGGKPSANPAAAGEGEAAGAGKTGGPKVEEFQPGDSSAATSGSHFTDANGAPTDQSLLQPGRAGQKELGRLLDGYNSTQNKIYAGTVNDYAQQMVNGTFNWDAVPAGERIVLDGNTIMSGHHRFVAAQLAAEATGRPLMGAADAIIPSNGFATEAIAQKTIAAGVRDPRAWSKVGVVDGVKAPTPVQTVDDDLQAIRDATGGGDD